MKQPSALTGVGIEARGLRADTIQFEPGEGAGAPTEVSLDLSDRSPENQKKRDTLLIAARAGKIARMVIRDVTFSSDDEDNERGYVFDKDEYGPFIESFAGEPFRKDHNPAYDACGGTVLSATAEPPDANGRRWAKASIELDEPWAMVGALTGKLRYFSLSANKPAQVICTVCDKDYLTCTHEAGRTYGNKKARILCKGVRGKEISVVSNPAYAGTGTGHVLDIAADAGTDTGGNAMDLKKLAKLVGLGEDATEEQVEAAITKKFAEIPTAPAESTAIVASIATFCGLEATATETEIKAAIMAAGYRPESEDDKKAIAELKAARRVDFWTKEKKKFAPAERAWALDQAIKDPVAFELFASKKAPVAPEDPPPGGQINGDAPGGGAIHAADTSEFGEGLTASDEPLTDLERKHLRTIKDYVSLKQYLKTRRAEAREARALTQ